MKKERIPEGVMAVGLWLLLVSVIAPPALICGLLAVGLYVWVIS